MVVETSPIVHWAHEAARHMARGNIGAAEAYSREILDRDPGHVASHEMLGAIAGQLGYSQLSAEHFDRAGLPRPLILSLSKEGERAGVRGSLSQATTNTGGDVHAEGKPGGSAKFLVIEAWGNGFWSDVCHVLGCLLLAEITGRIPVTHWGANSLFGGGTEDAFRLYFEPVSRFSMDDIHSAAGAAHFPPSSPAGYGTGPILGKADKSGLSGIHFLNRAETILVSDSYVSVFRLLPWIPKTHPLRGQPVDAVYRVLAEKYLHPVAGVRETVDAFYREKLAGTPAIAVHIRGSDKGSEMQQAFPGPEKYFALLDKEMASHRIFLLTDDTRMLHAFKQRYGERIVATNCQRTSANVGLHLQYATDRVRLAYEVMTDVFLALRCERFYGLGWSNVSAIVAMLKAWGPDQCFLLGPSILTNRFV